MGVRGPRSRLLLDRRPARRQRWRTTQFASRSFSSAALGTPTAVESGTSAIPGNGKAAPERGTSSFPSRAPFVWAGPAWSPIRAAARCCSSAAMAPTTPSGNGMAQPRTGPTVPPSPARSRRAGLESRLWPSTTVATRCSSSGARAPGKARPATVSIGSGILSRPDGRCETVATSSIWALTLSPSWPTTACAAGWFFPPTRRIRLAPQRPSRHGSWMPRAQPGICGIWPRVQPRSTARPWPSTASAA